MRKYRRGQAQIDVVILTDASFMVVFFVDNSNELANVRPKCKNIIDFFNSFLYSSREDIVNKVSASEA